MWKTRREFLACISRSPSLRAGDRRHRRGNSHPLRCASGGPLSFFSERKGGKNAVKTKVLKSFPRLRCRLHRSSLPRVSGCANSSLAFASSLRPHPRRALRLCCPGGTGKDLCVYRAARCGHRALHKKRSLSAGDDAHIVPSTPCSPSIRRGGVLDAPSHKMQPFLQ